MGNGLTAHRRHPRSVPHRARWDRQTSRIVVKVCVARSCSPAPGEGWRNKPRSSKAGLSVVQAGINAHHPDPSLAGGEPMRLRLCQLPPSESGLHAYAPAAGDGVGLIRWDRVCPLATTDIHAVIAGSAGFEAISWAAGAGSPRHSPNAKRPACWGGALRRRASAYWIARRWMKVWSPAVTFWVHAVGVERPGSRCSGWCVHGDGAGGAATHHVEDVHRGGGHIDELVDGAYSCSPLFGLA